MKIAILGAGAWGTALAVNAAGAHQVTLWSRDAAQAQAMALNRVNSRYLPDMALPASLALSSGQAQFAALTQTQDLIVIATPMAGLRGMLAALGAIRTPVAWLCKGFEAPLNGALNPCSPSSPFSFRGDLSGDLSRNLPKSSSFGLLAHEILGLVAPDLIAGVLSGPSFAQEVARGQPTALVAASQHADVRDALVAAFHGPTLRVYANEDLVGVEVGGAVKNVLAIATGLCDGLALGLNARAALITRGLLETTRLGLALGAKAETFTGLSGLGDLVLTATGDLSRNRKVGLALAQGKTLAQAIADLGHVAEGVYCAHTVVQRASILGIEMPISQAVVALLEGKLTPQQAVAALMGREPTAERI